MAGPSDVRWGSLCIIKALGPQPWGQVQGWYVVSVTQCCETHSLLPSPGPGQGGWQPEQPEPGPRGLEANSSGEGGGPGNRCRRGASVTLPASRPESGEGRGGGAESSRVILVVFPVWDPPHAGPRPPGAAAPTAGCSSRISGDGELCLTQQPVSSQNI